MKITKQMLHEDLQPKVGQLKLLTSILKRRWATTLANSLASRFLKGKSIDGLICSELQVPSGEHGYAVRVRVYRPGNHPVSHEKKLPMLLYIHGGGYVGGIPEIANASIKGFIETRPCVVIAPDYRKAYTKPYPAALEDCYETLLWARANATQLGVDADKIMVAGHSAGGGLTAALTLKARDTNDFNIAFQMPFYPMIDDQQPEDPERQIDSPVWNTATNRVGWRAYLSDLIEAEVEIPAYAAPMRNTDYTTLPPTITFVGTLEPFYWETVRYVESLKQAGVEVAFKQYPGCFHGFENVAPETSIGKDGLDFTYSNYAKFYDRYVS